MTMTAVLLEPPEGEKGRTKAIYSGLHQSILVYRSEDRTVIELESRGSWLGIIDEIEGLNEDNVVELASGDTLLLFTDGLIESRRRDDETKLVEIEAVKERFLEVCRKELPCDEITKSVLSVSTDGIVKDDISAVALRRLMG
jgi:serine phosphatase RsbU (regulator of sigma subunit)